MLTTIRTVIFKGKPTILNGSELKSGDKAPDFKLQDIDFNDVTLYQNKGKVKLLSVVVSLDTPVCDLQTQRFEEEASRFSDVVVYTISMDLPYAQARYCGAHNIQNLKTLSDHREASFGQAYGVLMQEPRLLSRAIFIIDTDDFVRYVEYVPEAGKHPDYDKAIAALQTIVTRS
jgi:thioredoxin-dependent peroxiredoxin